MGLHGKLVAAVEFKAGGDLHRELFTYKPHQVTAASPKKVQNCTLIEGEFGKEGSIICWRYTHDGEEKIAKQIVQTIDDEKKRTEFKVIEGDLMKEYGSFLITNHIETKNGIDLVTWTLEYEMLDETVGHPTSLLDYFIRLTKDIEAHHLK